LFLFPYLYGSLDQGLYATQPMDIVTAVKTWEHSAYVGILPLALAALALLELARFRRTTNDERRTTNDEGRRTKQRRQTTDDESTIQNPNSQRAPEIQNPEDDRRPTTD